MRLANSDKDHELLFENVDSDYESLGVVSMHSAYARFRNCNMTVRKGFEAFSVVQGSQLTFEDSTITGENAAMMFRV